jgi:hypothetical protein
VHRHIVGRRADTDHPVGSDLRRMRSLPWIIAERLPATDRLIRQLNEFQHFASPFYLLWLLGIVGDRAEYLVNQLGFSAFQHEIVVHCEMSVTSMKSLELLLLTDARPVFLMLVETRNLVGHFQHACPRLFNLVLLLVCMICFFVPVEVWEVISLVSGSVRTRTDNLETSTS